jgi:hypothetical protein
MSKMKPIVYRKFLRPEVREMCITAVCALNRDDKLPVEMVTFIVLALRSLFPMDGIHGLHYVEALLSNKARVAFTGSAALHEVMRLKYQVNPAQIFPTWYPRDIDVTLAVDRVELETELAQTITVLKEAWPGLTVSERVNKNRAGDPPICTSLKWGVFKVDIITYRGSTDGFDLQECGLRLHVRRNLECDHLDMCNQSFGELRLTPINTWTFRRVSHEMLWACIDEWVEMNRCYVDRQKVIRAYKAYEESRCAKYSERAKMDGVTMLFEEYEPDVHRLKYFLNYHHE